jgi:hypothetical protein
LELVKAKYFAFFFMLVLLTSGFSLNANNDGGILPTADAQVKSNGNKIFFCENNPIAKQDYNKSHMTPQDYMSKCKERTEGFSWGSRIYVLLWAPGFNADDKRLDELGGDATGSNGLIQINTREGTSTIAQKNSCNKFIETGIDHGLFYGSIKLSGYRTTINDNGLINYGGNRCESSQGTLDDGVLRAEAKQDGAITMSFQYTDDKSDTMFKTATHTWRIAELFFDAEEYEMSDKGKLTMSDLDSLKYPFDKRTAFPIHIYSDTDQAGVMIDAFWKANYRGTPQMKGEYPVNVSFIDPSNRESTSNSNLFGGVDGSRVEIKAVPGDNIYAEYFDYTLPAVAPDGKRYSTEDKLKITTIAKIVEVKSLPLAIEIVEVKDDSHTKQFAFTKYTSNGEYLVSVWWNQWDWWTNQPSSQADNTLNISIVEGLSEKPVSDVSYTLNVSSNGNSLINQESIYDGDDAFNVSLTDTDLIEVVFSNMGEVDESLKFKFKIDSDSNSN